MGGVTDRRSRPGRETLGMGETELVHSPRVRNRLSVPIPVDPVLTPTHVSHPSRPSPITRTTSLSVVSRNSESRGVSLPRSILIHRVRKLGS